MSTPAIIRPKPAGATTPTRLLTGEELLALGDVGPAELVRGEIRPHMPTGHPHGRIENIIGALLYIYLQEHNLGLAFSGEVGIYTQRDPDTVRAADVVYISHERYQQVQSSGYLDVAPELVVEILSPSDRWSDVQEKLSEYFSAGVSLIWLVDPQLSQVHVYRALDDVTLLQASDTLDGGDLLPGLQLSLSQLFTS